MANICDNSLYAYSEDRQNIDSIINFFLKQPYASMEDSGTSLDVYFESRWVFPEEEMNQLFESIPNKDDILKKSYKKYA